MLRLGLEASQKLIWTLPYKILFEITRQDDGIDRPLLFKCDILGDGFRSGGFVLLHHTENGLEPMELDHSGLLDLNEDTFLVNEYNHSLWQLKPGESIKLASSLPERYHKRFVLGQTYTLLWPGSKISTWEWGTKHEHMGSTLTKRNDHLLLPGGPHLNFTVCEHPEPWPDRAQKEAQFGFFKANNQEEHWRLRQSWLVPMPLRKTSERDPDAPKLDITLSCSPMLRRSGIFNVAATVTYDAPPTARPITFHDHIFAHPDCYQIYRLDKEKWQVFDNDEGCSGFRIVDDPDISVNVSQDDSFVSLQPGASWTTTQGLQSESWSELPYDLVDGEVLRFVFFGETMEWWDWGTKEEHGDMVVKLPCWITGPVVEPRDNDGRPKLAVPASNIVEFAFREE